MVCPGGTPSAFFMGGVSVRCQHRKSFGCIDNSLITENCDLDISEFAWLDSCGLGGRALAVQRTDAGALYWNYEKDSGQKYKCFPVVWTY